MQHNRIKNPNWQKATSWLFTSVAENLNSGRPSTNPASGQSGTRTRDRRIASPTRWPLGHAASPRRIPRTSPTAPFGPLGWIKLIVDEDPTSYKRWISRKEIKSARILILLQRWLGKCVLFFHNNISAGHTSVLQVYRCYWTYCGN